MPPYDAEIRLTTDVFKMKSDLGLHYLFRLISPETCTTSDNFLDFRIHFYLQSIYSYIERNNGKGSDKSHSTKVMCRSTACQNWGQLFEINNVVH